MAIVELMFGYWVSALIGNPARSNYAWPVPEGVSKGTTWFKPDTSRAEFEIGAGGGVAVIDGENGGPNGYFQSHVDRLQ